MYKIDWNIFSIFSYQNSAVIKIASHVNDIKNISDKWKLVLKSFFCFAKSDFVWETLIKTNLAQSQAHLLISANRAFYHPIHPYSPYRGCIPYYIFSHSLRFFCTEAILRPLIKCFQEMTYSLGLTSHCVQTGRKLKQMGTREGFVLSTADKICLN